MEYPPILFQKIWKSDKECAKEMIKKLEKRVSKIEKLVFPITGKGGKDGKDA